jgi:hypothetical protein
VDQAKVVAIIDMDTPTIDEFIYVIFEHIIYYYKLIRKYTKIIAPLEKLLKNHHRFIWTQKWKE